MEGSVSRRIRPVKEQLLELIALLEAGIDFAEDDISVAPAGGNPAPPDADRASAGAHGCAASTTASWCIPGSRWPSSAGPTSARAACSTGCWSRIAPSSPTSPAPRATWFPKLRPSMAFPSSSWIPPAFAPVQDLVETLGIERSYQAMADADLTLVVLDLSETIAAGRSGADRTRTSSKAADSGGKQIRLAATRRAVLRSCIAVSALTGEGIERLCAGNRSAGRSRAGLRIHHQHPARAAAARKPWKRWSRRRKAAEFGIPHEMLLLDLYAALRPIDAITGATTADDILNRIFSTFCIGK